MMTTLSTTQAVILGGGFYGVNIALYLASKGYTNIIIIEKEHRLLQRASYTNQARIHNGYHYPRSFTTAYRSRVNFPRFIQDWPMAVRSDFTKLYAIAKNNSKVSSKQFYRFCKDIGALIEPAETRYSKLFNPKLVDSVYLVQEYAFDTSKLEVWAIEALATANVTTLYDTHAISVKQHINNLLSLEYETKTGCRETIHTPLIFNCTYSGLGQCNGINLQTSLKHEITEMALMDMPPSLKKLGITVMDGAFFSMMPFPARGLHTLSHVRYTPHFSWEDTPSKDPYTILEAYPKESRANRMIRDVARYLPSITDAIHKDSIFEVKTILMKNEGNDGRPILFEKSKQLPGLYSILGGKIDNIYDIFERLENEGF